MEQRNKVRGLAHDRNVAKLTLVAVPDRPGRRPRRLRPARRAGHQRRHDRPERGPCRRDRPVLHGARASTWPGPSGSRPVVRELGFAEMTTDCGRRQGVDRRRRASTTRRLRGADVRRARRCRREHRDDLDVGDPHHLHHRRGRRRERRCGRCTRPSSSSSPRPSTTGGRAAGAVRRRVPADGSMTRRSSSRQERFPTSARRTTSSAAGSPRASPEVCLAVADEQSAGRGRHGRTWLAPPGAGAPAVARVPADLAGAGSHLAAGGDRGAGDGRRRREGRRPAGGRDPPEVAERPRGRDGGRRPRTGDRRRKLAGVLGETVGLGHGRSARVVGIGLNADWPAAAFPPSSRRR